MVKKTDKIKILKYIKFKCNKIDNFGIVDFLVPSVFKRHFKMFHITQKLGYTISISK